MRNGTCRDPASDTGVHVVGTDAGSWDALCWRPRRPREQEIMLQIVQAYDRVADRRFRGIARLRHMIWDKVEKLWQTSPHVIILGVGFGGIGALKKLRDADIRITLIDKHD